jgi:hypothetical protein
MQNKIHKIALYLIFAIFLILQCSTPNQISGGSSSETVIGKIVNADGSPACSTIVNLYPIDYDPVRHPPVESSSVDTTDQNGDYSFATIKPSTDYSIIATQVTSGLRAFITGISIDDDTTMAPDAILAKPGAISISAPKTADVLNGYLYIPGTGIVAFLNASQGLITLDQVPSGIISMVIYASIVAPGVNSIVDSIIKVAPGNTTVIPFPQWNYSKELSLNTTQSGAAVTGTVTNFPVLVRLTDKNFAFAQSMADGSDLRFTSKTGISLPFEIERWDPANSHGEIWVTVDTILGNNSSQSIMMYWGNPAASPLSKNSDVFDTIDGFQGVWHLGDGTEDSIGDATNNRYSGVSPDTANPSIVNGIIGNCREFDGTADFITIPNTAESKLNFPEDGYFTLSAWAYADTFDNVYRTIATKGYEQYFLQLSYFPGDKPLWQFSVFREDDNWNMSHIAGTEKKWMLLTGVRQGTSQYLYCNGELVANTSSVYDQKTTRNTTNDFSIGRFLQEATFPTNFGYCYFKGMIDEVRVCSVTRSPDWIKLCYMNQRSDDKLVQFK